jgi:hypothetical protein
LSRPGFRDSGPRWLRDRNTVSLTCESVSGKRTTSSLRLAAGPPASPGLTKKLARAVIHPDWVSLRRSCWENVDMPTVS